MPAYHSSLNGQGFNCVGGIPQLAEDQFGDAINDALKYFRPNVLFRTFEVEGEGDRLLIVLILVITEMLKDLKKKNLTSKSKAQKVVNSLVRTGLIWPGEASYPLNQFFEDGVAANKSYLQQLSLALGRALLDTHIYPNGDGPPNKFWIAFASRKFMNQSLRN